MGYQEFSKMCDSIGFKLNDADLIPIGDKFAIRGHVVLELVGPDGKLKEMRISKNTITQRGDMVTADAMSDRSETLPNYVGVGTTSGGKTTASDNLEAEVTVGGGHKLCTSRTQGTGGDDNDVVWIASFAAGEGTGALVEAGLFNVVSGAGMYAYQEFAAVNKGAADSLTITWTVTYGAS